MRRALCLHHGCAVDALVDQQLHVVGGLVVDLVGMAIQDGGAAIREATVDDHLVCAGAVHHQLMALLDGSKAIGAAAPVPVAGCLGAGIDQVQTRPVDHIRQSQRQRVGGAVAAQADLSRCC